MSWDGKLWLKCDDELHGCWAWRRPDGIVVGNEHHVESCPVRIEAEAAPESWFRPNKMAHTAGEVQGDWRLKGEHARYVHQPPRVARPTPPEKPQPLQPLLEMPDPPRPDWWQAAHDSSQLARIIEWTPEAMDPEALAKAWEYGTDRARVLGDVMMDRVQAHAEKTTGPNGWWAQP